MLPDGFANLTTIFAKVTTTCCNQSGAKMKVASAILETVIYAADIDAAEAFYSSVFGLKTAVKHPTTFVFFRCGRQMLLIFNPEKSSQPAPDNPIPRHGPSGVSHFCFYAKDAAEVAAWRAHFVDLGIAIEHDHIWPNGAVSVYIRDPAGNSVEVGEAKLWGFD